MYLGKVQLYLYKAAPCTNELSCPRKNFTDYITFVLYELDIIRN